jgi:hypothetical protein
VRIVPVVDELRRLPSFRNLRHAWPEFLLHVPGALTLVEFDRKEDVGLYVEPNIWMHHRR